MSQLFASGGQSIGVSASTAVLPMNTRTDLLLDGMVGSPCCPRDSQESSPTPQFKSINSSALIRFVYMSRYSTVDLNPELRMPSSQLSFESLLSLEF